MPTTKGRSIHRSNQKSPRARNFTDQIVVRLNQEQSDFIRAAGNPSLAIRHLINAEIASSTNGGADNE